MAVLTVSRLASRTGVSPDTIRYYERAGLLRPPTRSPGGYRLYDEEVVERVQLIRGAQRLGLRLREIAELLGVGDDGACPCGHTQALVQRRLSELDAELDHLVELRARLTRLAAGCANAPAAGRSWPCEVAFLNAAKEVNPR